MKTRLESVIYEILDANPTLKTDVEYAHAKYQVYVAIREVVESGKLSASQLKKAVKEAQEKLTEDGLLT